uniref:Neurotransmitter-gated ion-channel ligand-binding domain-containing protein n=1 Tax=Ditylenchus dipsaci TaxID=166011 RepID=A0A915CX02_9BILA
MGWCAPLKIAFLLYLLAIETPLIGGFIIRQPDGRRRFVDDPNSQLSNFIKARAKPYRRPVLHGDDLIEVHVRASLYQIVDLDQRNNLATLSAYFDVWWMDAFIPWNISDFDGITHTFVPVKWIWKPEFYLYHSIQGRTPEYDSSAMVEVRHDGMIRLFVPLTSRALCPINVKYFPYDTQNCSFLPSSVCSFFVILVGRRIISFPYKTAPHTRREYRSADDAVSVVVLLVY